MIFLSLGVTISEVILSGMACQEKEKVLESIYV